MAMVMARSRLVLLLFGRELRDEELLSLLLGGIEQDGGYAFCR